MKAVVVAVVSKFMDTAIRLPSFRKGLFTGEKNPWGEEKEKYELCVIPGPNRVVAHKLKDTYKHVSVVDHYLCTNCFDVAGSILQRSHHRGWYCPRCDTDFRENPYPKLKP